MFNFTRNNYRLRCVRTKVIFFSLANIRLFHRYNNYMRAIPANLHHKRIKFRGNASQSPLLYINIYLVKKQSVFFTQRHPAYQIQNHGILTAHSPSGRKTRRCVKLFWFDTPLFLYIYRDVRLSLAQNIIWRRAWMVLTWRSCCTSLLRTSV